MGNIYEKVDDDVLAIARDVQEKWHPNLFNARIAFLFRDEAPKTNGKITLGKASKVSDQWRPLLDQNYHFVIWFAANYWFNHLDMDQKRALMDHELCHCRLVDGVPTIRGHDIEEFIEVVQRHGAWTDSLRAMEATVTHQPWLFDTSDGGMFAPNPKRAAQEAADLMQEVAPDFADAIKRGDVVISKG